MILLHVALGGALGASARHLLSLWVYSWSGVRFPWGTFAVNVIGCLALGFLARSMESPSWTPEARAFVAAGLLGGFTTFSTFSYETLLLVQGGAWTRAALYALGSLGVGLLAALAGFGLGGVAFPPRG